MGERELEFSRELYIESEDFMENPPGKFFRLRPGGEVRLRYGYIIKCDEVIKDDNGDVIELLCTYDPDTRSGSEASQRKVKGTIHWVSAKHAVRAEVRLYDRLFNVARPDQESIDFRNHINPASLELITDARIEAGLLQLADTPVQFERTGYFITDAIDSSAENPVFNRIVTLRDSWAKIEKAELGDS